MKKAKRLPTEQEMQQVHERIVTPIQEAHKFAGQLADDGVMLSFMASALIRTKDLVVDNADASEYLGLATVRGNKALMIEAITGAVKKELAEYGNSPFASAIITAADVLTSSYTPVISKEQHDKAREFARAYSYKKSLERGLINWKLKLTELEELSNNIATVAKELSDKVSEINDPDTAYVHMFRSPTADNEKDDVQSIIISGGRSPILRMLTHAMYDNDSFISYIEVAQRLSQLIRMGMPIEVCEALITSLESDANNDTPSTPSKMAESILDILNKKSDKQ